MRSILPAPPSAALCRRLPRARRPRHRRAPIGVLVGLVALGGLSCGAQAADDAARDRRWEGAVGLIATWAPEYDGASASSLRLVPAGFVRYGRLSISGAGGFTTRRSDDVDRGVSANLVDWTTLRVSLGLRFDSGRDEADSTRLDGMGDIDPTLRAQLSVRWRPWRHWTLTTAMSADAIGKGNGWWLQAGVNRNIRLTPDSALGLGVSARWVGEDYAQRWYGVTPAQSATSGHPVYVPGSGLSDVQMSGRLRTNFGAEWSGFVGASVSWQLGRARQSPLTQEPFGWSVGSGLVWRF